ncbi:MAG TPA: histidine kinase [Lacunisphaera sp.]|jgi:hypothetical protein|nr:histidine kinase [Lacunisphaera sp.]
MRCGPVVNLSLSSLSSFFGCSTPRGRRTLQVQLLLLLGLSTLLYIGFPGTRKWQQFAEEEHLRTIIRGWDGLAWYVWVGTAPFMLVLIHRYPLTGGRIRQNLGGILLGSLTLYLVAANVRFLCRVLSEFWGGANPSDLIALDAYLYNTFGLLPLDVLTYCGFFAVSFSVDYYFQYRQDAEEAMRLQLRAAKLQTDLTRSELAALRGQLHPHFLFNSFNALATLVRQKKNSEAVEIIAQLSALLRLAIERTGLTEIPLHQEMDFIERYLAIERVRYAEKLRIELAVDPATLDALVPNIVLQPLVENAIKHGISRRTTPGTVRLASSAAGGRLRIMISNDRADEPAAGAVDRSASTGIGLANTRAQLEKLYGVDYRLEFLPDPGGITTVALDLPLRMVAPMQTP